MSKLTIFPSLEPKMRGARRTDRKKHKVHTKSSFKLPNRRIERMNLMVNQTDYNQQWRATDSNPLLWTSDVLSLRNHHLSGMNSKDFFGPKNPIFSVLHFAQTQCAAPENLNLTNVSQDVSKTRLHALRFTCSFTVIFVKSWMEKELFNQPAILSHSYTQLFLLLSPLVTMWDFDEPSFCFFPLCHFPHEAMMPLFHTQDTPMTTAEPSDRRWKRINNCPYCWLCETLRKG